MALPQITIRNSIVTSNSCCAGWGKAHRRCSIYVAWQGWHTILQMQGGVQNEKVRLLQDCALVWVILPPGNIMHQRRLRKILKRSTQCLNCTEMPLRLRIAMCARRINLLVSTNLLSYKNTSHGDHAAFSSPLETRSSYKSCGILSSVT